MIKVHLFFEIIEKGSCLGRIQAVINPDLQDTPVEIVGVFSGVAIDEFLSLEKSSMVKMMIKKNGSSVLNGLVVGRNDTNLFERTQLTSGPLRSRVFRKRNIGLFGAKLGVTPPRLFQNFLESLQGDLHVAGVLSDDLIQVEVPGFNMPGLIGLCRKFS